VAGTAITPGAIARRQLELQPRGDHPRAAIELTERDLALLAAIVAKHVRDVIAAVGGLARQQLDHRLIRSLTTHVKSN
jgi:hypothetical protein